MTDSQRVLVCGGSIAGPTVAYWLARAGHQVTVVERSAKLRDSGQNIDVRGSAREVLRRMDLEARVRSAGTGEAGLRFVDDDGAVIAEFPAGSGDSDGPTAEVEILRGELSRILVEAGGTGVEYSFGDYVTGLEQDADGVSVEFQRAATRRFDLVVIAEGTRSWTRDLIFGDEVESRDLGLYTAYGTIPRTDDDDDWWRWFNAPGGRTITLRPDNLGTTRVTLSFLGPPRGYENLDADGQASALRTHFDGAGWQTARILDALGPTANLYVDRLDQVRAPRWSKGRVALLGDAAWCATPLSGMGTTLAITGAYVLAGEIIERRDHLAAFAEYERLLRPFVTRTQKLPPGVPRVAHPKTRAGVGALRAAVRLSRTAPVRFVADRLGGSSSQADQFALPGYGELAG